LIFFLFLQCLKNSSNPSSQCSTMFAGNRPAAFLTPSQSYSQLTFDLLLQALILNSFLDDLHDYGTVHCTLWSKDASALSNLPEDKVYLNSCSAMKLRSAFSMPRFSTTYSKILRLSSSDSFDRFRELNYAFVEYYHPRRIILSFFSG